MDITIASNEFIDFLRIIAVMLGGVLAAVSLVRFMQRERFWSALGFGCLGLLAALQESDQIHHPFLVWRLPLFLVGIGAGLRYMWMPLAEIKRGTSH